MHFGIITPPVSGHLHPFGALGRELIARGHRVTVFHMPDLAEKVEGEALEFCAMGESDHPRGSLPENLQQLNRLKGRASLRFTLGLIARTTEMICRDAPAAIQRAGVDALLVDQTEPAGGTVAEHLGMPFLTICNALAINREPDVPPVFTPWSPAPGFLGRLRNRTGYAVFDYLTRPIKDVLAAWRRNWKLAAHRTPDDAHSRLAQICQMPAAFDFPRQNLPAGFHYVGPLRRPKPSEVPFPWEKLDGRPLIYASLGTLQNAREDLFACFAEACRPLDVQLVLSHGGGLTEDAIARLPKGPIVVSYAPQDRLIARAALTLTHAGLNTVLDSLSHGVPMVAIPLTYEQPAIAARIRWTGSGEVLSPREIAPERLRKTITQVMEKPAFRGAAANLKDAIQQAGGALKAARMIEAIVSAQAQLIRAQ